jgi:hypothetical protein
MELIERLRSFKHNNVLSRLGAIRRGQSWSPANGAKPAATPKEPENPLREFFHSRKQGRGIWKWDHYFEIYHRHFAPFRNTPVNIVEIGVLGGGSLDMWRQYFGLQASIFGVDIDPACTAYETDGVKIFIGNQKDRNFWHNFRAAVPKIDIVIDDGCHMSLHQITTLEELLPAITPGGVYLCEDIHREENAFSSYVHGLISSLNRFDYSDNLDNPERRMVCKPSPVQQHIRAISVYPYVTVIEKSSAVVPELISTMHGTEWEPPRQVEIKRAG